MNVSDAVSITSFITRNLCPGESFSSPVMQARARAFLAIVDISETGSRVERYVGWRGWERMAGLRSGVERKINSLLLGISAKVFAATRLFVIVADKIK